MAQLEELLQKASSTPEARQSLSGEHTNPYHLELNQPAGRCKLSRFFIHKHLVFKYCRFLILHFYAGLVKDSQPDSVGWEDPVRRVPPPQRQVG